VACAVRVGQAGNSRNRPRRAVREAPRERADISVTLPSGKTFRFANVRAKGFLTVDLKASQLTAVETPK